MSAILGSLAPSGGAAPADHRAMVAALDGWGRAGAPATSGPATAGIVDHRGVAPLVDADGLVLVADVRLDDRSGLSAELGVAPGRSTDAELILRAYRRWDADCVRHLVGAFAFAMWDPRAERLLLARDHIGLRALYHGAADGTLVFASTPEAVLAGLRAPAVLDELAAVARMVSHHGILRERSFAAGVWKVPPGEVLAVRPGRAPVRRVHWEPRPRPLLSLGDPREYAEAVRATLEVCVDAAAGGDRPVATHLSGGLDSSAVAAVAQRRLSERGKRLACGFSWSPAPGDADSPGERERVRQMAELLELPVAWTQVTPEDLEADLRRDLAVAPNASTLYERHVLARCAAEGIGVVLSGWGGDEGVSFHGGHHLAGLARRGNPLPFWRQAVAGGRRVGLRGAPMARHLAARTLKDVVAPALGDRTRTRLGLHSPTDRFEHSFDWAALHPLAPELRREALARLAPRRDARESQTAWLANGHVTSRLEAWAELAGPHDVEYRFPLLDRRLLDLCLSLPASVWCVDGYNRWVFRKAVEPLLPASVVWGTPKAEPARVGSYRRLFCDGWQPAVEAATPVAGMVVAHRRSVQQGLRSVIAEDGTTACIPPRGTGTLQAWNPRRRAAATPPPRTS